jgi:hypothetical protein
MVARFLPGCNIQPGFAFLCFTVPVAESWPITPDEPLKGGAVNNSLKTAPEPAIFGVKSANYPQA